MAKLFRILANLSTLFGIIIFIFPLISIDNLTLKWFQWLFIGLSALICIIYVIYELASSPKQYKTEKAIKDYMEKWINKRGRTVIFTRDMTWVDDKIKDDLRRKAKDGELIICQPSLTRFTNELKSLGAEINTYDNINFIPKSRFTFINYNTNSSKVAIGRKDKNHVHYINEFSTSDTIEYYLAEDLVNLIKSLNK